MKLLKKWHKRERCEKCKRFRTWGGIKFLCFRFKKWSKICKCLWIDGSGNCDVKPSVGEASTKYVIVNNKVQKEVNR